MHGFPDLGTDRFVLQRKLGSGGFGTVFEALDMERKATVALKTLERPDPSALYGFKREFRALTEITHPNLVQLYELHGEDERWFFTMELVAGKNAFDALRSTSDSASSSEQSDPSTALAPSTPSDASSTVSAPPKVSVRVNGPHHATLLDEGRVRAVFRQVAEGLCCLHEAGRLHRDIKPSNVTVTPEGRAVILDFGLVVELDTGVEQSLNQFAGTPLYMAPEQTMGDAVGPPADWYALGVMLYEVLTGQTPFTGTLSSVLFAKSSQDPRPPGELVPGLPEDLCRLAMDLLAREPAQRPDGKTILERLGGETKFGLELRTATKESKLVGRAAELAALEAAFAATRAGRAGVVLLHGRSGMGKSAVARRFLDDVRAADSSAVVLTGRCFEQESVPYKALDSVVDALCRHLRRAPSADVDAVLPRDVVALVRLFPVLLEVSLFESHAADPTRQLTTTNDKLELRRRAFAALRELLARFGDRRPLLLFIDDLQWGDIDSGALLSELLRPPDAPVLLFVAAYRTDEAERSECLKALLPTLQAFATQGLDRREIAVERLSNDEARALALAELAAQGRRGAERADRIVRESGGWPFFIRELARFSGELDADALPSLDDMIRARVGALPEDERRLVEVVAVAGQPIERAVAAEAAELGGREPACVSALRRQRLLRIRGRGGIEELETYHDRIRETVVQGLEADIRCAHHEHLGTTLEATGKADAETLAIHFQAAGKHEQAARYAEIAADRAIEALGFDRATRLYRQAIDLLPVNDPRHRMLHEKLGVALSDAGRSADAGQAYLVAAEGCEPTRALELRRRAAENQLIAGHIEQGMAIIREVLASSRVTLPATNFGAILRVLPLLLLLKFRGFGYRKRLAREIPTADLLRLDAIAAVSICVMEHAPIKSLYIQKVFLWRALRAGEPRRILQALMYDITYRSLTEGMTPSRVEKRVRQMAFELVEQFPDQRARLDVFLGSACNMRMQYREARTHLERAESGLLEQRSAAASTESALPGGIYMDLAVARYNLCMTLALLGAGNDLRRRFPSFLEDARARGDIHLERLLLSQCGWYVALVHDRPEECREAIERADFLWSDQSQLKRFLLLLPRCTLAHYEASGMGPGALRVIDEHWPDVEQSRIIMLSETFGAIALSAYASAYIAAAASESGARRQALLRAAEKGARRLYRRTSTFRWRSWLVDSSIAVLRGNREKAIGLLLKAETACAAVDLGMMVGPIRRRRGELIGGEEGRALIESADAELRAEGIVNPERLTAAMVPGSFA